MLPATSSGSGLTGLSDAARATVSNSCDGPDPQPSLATFTSRGASHGAPRLSNAITAATLTPIAATEPRTTGRVWPGRRGTRPAATPRAANAGAPRPAHSQNQWEEAWPRHG